MNEVNKLMQERLIDGPVLKTLEFQKVLQQLEQHATCSLGKGKVKALRPFIDLEKVGYEQRATFEGVTVFRLKGDVPLGGIYDVRPHISRAQIGGILSPSELLEIMSTLSAGRRIKHYLDDLCMEEGLNILLSLVEQISGLKPLEQQLSAAINDHGEVVDTASSDLRKVRQEIRNFESTIKQRLEQMIRSSSNQKMLQEALVTIRNDRYVIPVKQEYRSNFGGIIHDQSASGATLFIEPQSIVQLNNQLGDARVREEREIQRILRELTSFVAVEGEAILLNVDVLGELDFIFAKARYANTIQGTEPKLNDHRYLKLKRGRHPLIPSDEIVPIDVELGRDFSMLIVTGPNTGGKTVTLKTIGLITLMAQSGLHIPCDDGSEIAVFDDVFADIGDEQSIEQSLSTFSSHLKNIIGILKEMTFNSLVLLDELGAGTDPTEGSALGMALLDHIHGIGARVVATTHYSELKAYAYNRSGVMNASVEFDVETLSPTYRLLVGVPGRSNAFAIARRLGLSEHIVDQARSHINVDNKQVDSMIASLEENRKGAEEERRQVEQLRRELDQLKAELEMERDNFSKEREQLLAQAREEAQDAVRKAQAEAEAVIDELRQMAKEEGASIKEHRLIEAKKRLEGAVPQWKQQTSRSKAKGREKRKLKLGDEVVVLSVGQKGTIVELVGDDEYQVQVGIMKIKVGREGLQYIKEEPERERRSITKVTSNRATIRTELDLRGSMVDEAIVAIDKYLDEALLAGLNQVTIIHGFGTGSLRKGVQEHLRRHRNVKGMRAGVHGEGGSGVTIVELK